MAIDINDLNEWLKTDEGKQWGDQLKAPLLNKRDELLKELKSTGGRLTDLELRSKQTEGILSEEQAVLSAVLVDKELAGLLKEKRVFESVIPSVIATLKETYGITVKANGSNRIACGKAKGENGVEGEMSLTDIVSTWGKTQEAKQVIQNGNSGGGSLGSFGYTLPKTPELQKLSGKDLASMTDAEFRAMRDKALNSAREIF